MVVWATSLLLFVPSVLSSLQGIWESSGRHPLDLPGPRGAGVYASVGLQYNFTPQWAEGLRVPHDVWPQRNATLSVGNLLRSAYLFCFSQPAADKGLTKARRTNRGGASGRGAIALSKKSRGHAQAAGVEVRV